MSVDRYKIANKQGTYFLTLTVIDWLDLFTRKEYCNALVDSLNYCIKEKGLGMLIPSKSFNKSVMVGYIYELLKGMRNFEFQI